MINDVLKNITIISDDEETNSNNFIDALNYLDNLYLVCHHLVGYVSLNDMDFLPTFKSRELSQKLGILSTDKENELKIFKISSDKFLGDNRLIKKIETDLSSISDEIHFTDNILDIILK